ncbi:hypothetical protein BD408DRAFT_409422 [Parasitella parasitica]|nr:hypothetical protein BD408DRAFT_409422 [Parasitella parasitica]
MISGRLCLVKIDNIDEAIIPITFDHERAAKILKYTENTVYVCYKKLNKTLIINYVYF